MGISFHGYAQTPAPVILPPPQFEPSPPLSSPVSPYSSGPSDAVILPAPAMTQILEKQEQVLSEAAGAEEIAPLEKAPEIYTLPPASEPATESPQQSTIKASAEDPVIAEQREASPSSVPADPVILPAPEAPAAVPEITQTAEPAQSTEAIEIPETKTPEDVASITAEPEPGMSDAVETREVAPVPETAQSGPEPSMHWHADFIRNLIGGDGTLDIISADAATAPGGDVVQLDQAVSMALSHNPQIKATLESIESRKWEKIGAYSQFLPVVQLDLASGDERSRPASYNDAFGNRVTDNTHHRHDRVFTVRQPLVDLGFISDILLGETKEEMAGLESMDVQNTVASSAVTAYLRLLQSKISIQLAEQYKTYLDDLAEKMKARVEGGGASAADLDRIIARSTQAENARVEAESEYQSSLIELQRLIGAVPLKIRVPDVMAPDIPPEPAMAMDAAYKQNAAYLVSLKKIELAKGERNRSYSSMAPKIYAQYTSGYSYNAGGSANGNPVDGVYPSQRTDAAMLVAQWTLNGGVPVAGGLSAEARSRQASMDSLDMQQKMDQGIKVGYTAIATSRERLDVLQKAVEANERVIIGFEEQYKNGTRSAFELLDAYEQLYNARLNLMRVIFAYSMASYQVHTQMGDIVPSILRTRGG